MNKPPLAYKLARPVRYSVNECKRRFNIITRRPCRLPDFIIIGAQKAATTSLYQYLVQHPAVDSAIDKETHYFDNRYHAGEAWYRSNFPVTNVNGDDQAIRVVGEASPYYFVHPRVPERLKSLCPNARLIVLLRDPVGRAVSQYFHERRRGFERLPLKEALLQEQDRIAGEGNKLRDPRYRSFAYEHFTYVTRGLYADQLKKWFEYFDRDQLLILESEELKTSPSVVLSEVAEFLSIPKWQPNVSEVHNPGGTYTASDDIVEWLQSRFLEPNRQLRELLGRDFSWNSET